MSYKLGDGAMSAITQALCAEGYGEVTIRAARIAATAAILHEIEAGRLADLRTPEARSISDSYAEEFGL